MPYTSLQTIKNWAEDDRPREKLLLKGKSALSDAELLAILIGSGSAKETAVDLAKRILKSVNNNLNELGRLDTSGLKNFKGIGDAKAITIMSAMELGRRRRLSELGDKPQIKSSADAFGLMQPKIGDLNYEEFWVIYLNNHNKVISCACISKGGLQGTVADTRLIFKEAVVLNATAIILSHNHPSGNLKPSQADINLTKKLKEAGSVMSVEVLDHIIVASNTYLSFADEGLMY